MYVFLNYLPNFVSFDLAIAPSLVSNLKLLNVTIVSPVKRAIAMITITFWILEVAKFGGVLRVGAILIFVHSSSIL